MNKRFKRGLMLLICCIPLLSTADTLSKEELSVSDLQQQALLALAQGGDFKQNESKIFLGVTIKGNLDKAQVAWQQAINVEPQRADLRLSLSSVEVLSGQLSAARENYQILESHIPGSPELIAYQAGYAFAAGDQASADKYEKSLRSNSSSEAAKYLVSLNLIKNCAQLAPLKKFNGKLNQGPTSAIIILGYALRKDGTMDDKLLQRLQTGLQLYRYEPTTQVIVSGGVAQGGVTEAYLMSKWLEAHGVPKSQLTLEDKSIDTVSNALNTLNLLEHPQQLKNIIIVSSASHLRRAVAVFSQVRNNLGLNFTVDSQAAWDFPQATAPLASENEKALIVRDTFRAAGLWAFPGALR